MNTKLLSCLCLCALASQSNAHVQALDYGNKPIGFYQIQVIGNEVFAALGGSVERITLETAIYPPGKQPGAVLVFNADSLQLQQEIGLEAAAGALAHDRANNRLLVGHTRHNAFSAVDLKTRKAHYQPVDLTHEGSVYRMRYLAVDSQGDVYASTFRMELPFQSAIFKFNAQGQRDAAFRVQPFEGFAIPLLLTRSLTQGGREQLLYGNNTLRVANTASGANEYQSARPVGKSEGERTNFFNFALGPGASILASSQASMTLDSYGDYNLYQFTLGKEDQPQRLFTANTALEVLYNPDAGQLYATSFADRLLSIVALANDGDSGLEQAPFENIRIGEGAPNSIAMRRTKEATELFVTLRMAGNQIAKVSIANTVSGIKGIRAPGACTVTLWDLQTRQASTAQPCAFEDRKAHLERNLQKAQDFAKSAPQRLLDLEKSIETSRAALVKTERELADNPDQSDLVQAQEKAKFMLFAQQVMQTFLRASATYADQGAENAGLFLEEYQTRDTTP